MHIEAMERFGGLSLARANPRHQHEIALFRKLKPPADLVLYPGCIDVTYNYLEHPELVAKRILEFVDVIGDREHRLWLFNVRGVRHGRRRCCLG